MVLNALRRAEVLYSDQLVTQFVETPMEPARRNRKFACVKHSIIAPVCEVSKQNWHESIGKMAVAPDTQST